jgi:hypothetical protein
MFVSLDFEREHVDGAIYDAPTFQPFQIAEGANGLLTYPSDQASFLQSLSGCAFVRF